MVLSYTVAWALGGLLVSSCHAKPKSKGLADIDHVVLFMQGQFLNG
jgi:hypothetical protein